MKKQKSIGNKGFSLVELIIVIAIMAILVGVMAPQLLKYIEKTRVSADTQFADTVRTAITTAMMDPANMESTSYTADIAALSSATNIESVGSSLKAAVAETLGLTAEASLTSAWVTDNLKSKDATGITVQVIGSNKVRVVVKGSHADGGNGTDEIVVE